MRRGFRLRHFKTQAEPVIRECPLLALSAPLLASNDVALGTKRTWTDVRLESAFGRIADAGLVRDVPGFGEQRQSLFRAVMPPYSRRVS